MRATPEECTPQLSPSDGSGVIIEMRSASVSDCSSSSTRASCEREASQYVRFALTDEAQPWYDGSEAAAAVGQRARECIRIQKLATEEAAKRKETPKTSDHENGTSK